MRCEVCNKSITGEPLTRKTCCVNKLKIFCSKNCLQKWNRQWLKRQVNPNDRKKILI